jgi:general secretion pathway protein B
LKLTGIGWQKDAASRFAVINGTAVGEGGIVDGAKVEEILPEKVRLKMDGKTIEIGLGK